MVWPARSRRSTRSRGAETIRAAMARFPFCQLRPSAPCKPQVLLSMAIHTESDQISDFISAKPASKSQVVNVEVGRRPADLAAPTVTLQYPQSLRMILLRVQLQPKLLPHGLFSNSLIQNSGPLLGGASSSERLAPARKSAQIISRQ